MELTNPIEKFLSNEKYQGFWRSEGYGICFEVADKKFANFYDITDISCLKSDSMLELIKNTEVRYKELEKNRIKFYAEGLDYIRTFCKMKKVPLIGFKPVIQKLSPPEQNFEVFWHTINEHYAFFEKRGMDWYKIYKKFRPKVTAETTEKGLFLVISKMLSKFKDFHLLIESNEYNWRDVSCLPKWIPLERAIETMARMNQSEKSKSEKFYSIWEDFALQEFIPLIKQKYLNNAYKRACNMNILYGTIQDEIGYIFVAREQDYVETNPNSMENIKIGLQVLHAALDDIVEELKTLKGIIVDLRFNLGGNGVYSKTIAERFADHKRIAFKEQTRLGDGFTNLRETSIDPTGKKCFPQKKVAVLISGLTISAGEVFCLCFHALPHPKFFGEPTIGVFSSVLRKQLPNGWYFTFSNEIIYSHDDVSYEYVKFPPTFPIPIDIEAAKNGTDRVLEAAIGYIQK